MGKKKKKKKTKYSEQILLFFTLHDVYDIILIYVANDYYQVYIQDNYRCIR